MKLKYNGRRRFSAYQQEQHIRSAISVTEETEHTTPVHCGHLLKLLVLLLVLEQCDVNAIKYVIYIVDDVLDHNLLSSDRTINKMMFAALRKKRRRSLLKIAELMKQTETEQIWFLRFSPAFLLLLLLLLSSVSSSGGQVVFILILFGLISVVGHHV